MLSITFLLSTSAIVANRYMTLYFRNTGLGTDWFRVRFPIPHTASLVLQYWYAINYPVQPWWATGTAAIPEQYHYLPLPDLELGGTDRIGSIVTNLQGGDNISNIVLRIRRWNDEII